MVKYCGVCKRSMNDYEDRCQFCGCYQSLVNSNVLITCRWCGIQTEGGMKCPYCGREKCTNEELLRYYRNQDSRGEIYETNGRGGLGELCEGCMDCTGECCMTICAAIAGVAIGWYCCAYY